MTAEVIELNNTLYHRVVRNCEKFNKEFDVTFGDLVAELIDSNQNKRRKTVEELILIACNDL